MESLDSHFYLFITPPNTHTHTHTHRGRVGKVAMGTVGQSLPEGKQSTVHESGLKSSETMCVCSPIH